MAGHLIHGEENDWVPRARLILEHGEDRPFEPFDRFAQLSRVMAKRYTQEVGAWRAYLSILNR